MHVLFSNEILMAKVFVQRDYMNVVDEIQVLVERHGVGHLMWLDDDLLKDERRALAMFNEIVRRT